MNAGLLAALLLPAPLALAAQAPNIVVLDVCSARADRFGAYGSRAGLTPGLDAFAAEATVFERAWAQASWCLPNHATLLTGLRPEAHGLHVPSPDGSARRLSTVAERLRGAGYRTGGFTGGVFLQPAWGLSRGFDRYVSALSTSAPRPESFDALRPLIERWLDEPSESPFFLYATVDDLHAPFGEPGGPASTAALAGVAFFRAYNGEPGADDALARALRGDAAFLSELSARYDGAVRRMDRSVSAFIDSLKRRKGWKDTVVVVTADHGEMLGEKGLLGHTERLYEPVLRVPLLVRHPRIPASRGARVPALVERADLAPTLLDAAGVPDPWLPGSSLLPLLRDPSAGGRPYVYASSQRSSARPAAPFIGERALSDGRWKLHWYADRPGFELYDLAEDPGETRDLAAERPALAARLAFELQRQAEAARRAGEPAALVPSPSGE